MEAKRLSPASSEIRNKYSGALTWLDRWERPVVEDTTYMLWFNFILGLIFSSLRSGVW